jgi:hypothetical protein
MFAPRIEAQLPAIRMVDSGKGFLVRAPGEQKRKDRSRAN